MSLAPHGQASKIASVIRNSLSHSSSQWVIAKEFNGKTMEIIENLFTYRTKCGGLKGAQRLEFSSPLTKSLEIRVKASWTRYHRTIIRKYFGPSDIILWFWFATFESIVNLKQLRRHHVRFYAGNRISLTPFNIDNDDEGDIRRSFMGPNHG